MCSASCGPMPMCAGSACKDSLSSTRPARSCGLPALPKTSPRKWTSNSGWRGCAAFPELKPVVCNDIRTDATLAPHQEDLLAHGHRSMAAFPLVLNDHAEGVIVFLGSAVGQFDRDEMKLLGEVAGDLSFGMDFIAKREQLNYLAYFDLLTGLPNKTLFHERLSQCLDGSKDAAKVAVI